MDKADPSLNRKYMAEGVSNKVVKAYLSYMVDVAVILGAEKSRAEKELSEVLSFEIEMAKVSFLSYILIITKPIYELNPKKR